MPTSREIGKMFKDARESTGLSIEEAGRKSHILANVIKDIETGVFDSLGKAYLKGFMKKYAEFLDLDADKILMDYESISSSIPTKEFNIKADPKEEKLDVVLPIHEKQKMRNLIVAGLSVIFIVLIVILISMLKDRPSSSERYKELALRVDSKVATVKSEPKTEKAHPVKPAPSKSTEFTLGLRAQDEAWVQVKKGDKTLYAGIMEPGERKSFTDDGTLVVLTGKGEDLLFTLNGRDIGVVEEGVVKNIKVSSKGIQLGSSWVTRLE